MILSNFSTEVNIFPVADGNVLLSEKFCYQHLNSRTDDHSLRPRWLSHDVKPWLWNFAPVLVRNVCGDCLTTYKHDFSCETLHQFWCETFAVIVWRHTNMIFAAILCTSSGVKLLRWLSDDIRPWLLKETSKLKPKRNAWVDLEREWFQFHLMETANLMLWLCSSYFA